MKKSLFTLLVVGLTTQIALADSTVKNSEAKTTELKAAQTADNKLTERGQLLSSELVVSISKDKINAYFPERKDMKGNIDDLPKYDIDLYKITYGSIYQDKLVKLSGLVVVPKKAGKLTHLQYHHGTILPYPAPDGWGSQDAPSLYQGTAPAAPKEQYETRLNANYLGSYGYLVSLPDYAGYGVGANLEHPYAVNTELAKESVDMLLATKAFAKQKNIPLNDGVFLSGWSEGGAIAVATQKLIESQYKDKINLLGTSSMSGLLNVTGQMEKIFTETPTVDKDLGEAMDFLLWMYYSYNKFSPKPIAFDKLFKMPVTRDLDVLKNRPSSVPTKVLKQLDKETFNYMMEQAKAYDLARWKPINPLFLHQGTADEVVPFPNNSEVAMAYFMKHGGNATLQKYEGHSHASLGLLQLKNMIADFEAIQSK